MRSFAALTPGLVAFARMKREQSTVHCQAMHTSGASVKDQSSGGLAPVKTASVVQQAKALSATRFQKGNFWVWLYRTPSGEPYSWERYTVCESRPDGEVVIEMSSRFSEDEKYSAHHRMTLSLDDCLAAKVYHKTWRFHEFAYKLEGEWVEAPFNDNVQAFEEKFNVFLMGRDGLPASTTKVRTDAAVIPGDFSPTGLVQTKRHGYTNSWYAHHLHQHAGLAAFKEFTEDHQEEGRSYTFELIDMGHDAVSKRQVE